MLAAIRLRSHGGRRRGRSSPTSIRGTGARRTSASGSTELLADARGLYSLRDDDNGVCFVWPLGLIRRGVLEAGTAARAAATALREVDDLFDATPDEIGALLQR